MLFTVPHFGTGFLDFAGFAMRGGGFGTLSAIGVLTTSLTYPIPTAMAALAAAVTATLAALHLENSSSHHSTDPRTAENALLALQNSGRLPYNNSGRLHTHLFIIY